MDNLFNMNNDFLKKVEGKFEANKSLAKGRYEKLFDVFSGDLSNEEVFALKFLYAYMPLRDMANYHGELFLKYVRHSLSIREKTPWGKSMPDYLFLYYVLPYRVNNEDIDGSRGDMFEELFPRINSLSMYDAILEVNHWCHEKANYISTNDRTASPTTCMKSARGRCGEESVLAVSALRSVGIPARQCYAPRWSHCDDNHAWVEAWADGKWYFHGACEPEPRLNQGWFTDSAARAMLVHAKVMGDYEGPERVVEKSNNLYELNLLDNYAPTKKITVKVKNERGESIKGAAVHFQVYNYSEFADITSLITDEKGEASLITGLGDLMIYAHSNESFGFRKINVKDEEYIEICVSDEISEDETIYLEMEPPAIEYMETVKCSTDELNINAERFKKEDEIRSSYEDTFIKEDEAMKIAEKLSLPEDRVWNVIKNSRGNCREIADFLKYETKGYGEWCLKLLETLEKKDLIDISIAELKDHLYYSIEGKDNIDEELFCKYILCPRIETEKISLYREFFNNKFTDVEKSKYRQNSELLVKWCEDNIEVTKEYCYFKGMAYPRGTFEIGKADRASRDILLIAMARSFNIAARLNPYDKSPEFYESGQWKSAEDKSKGRIIIKKLADINDKIEYFINFTISRLENGYYKTLDFSKTALEEFYNSIELPCGKYRIITGDRLQDGKVKVRIETFTVKKDETTTFEFIFPEREMKLEMLGTIDYKEQVLKNIVSDLGSVIMWVDADKEPSKHLMHEVSGLRTEFEKYKGKVSVLSDKEDFEIYLKNTYKLPDNISFHPDKEHELLNKIFSYLKDTIKHDLPLVFILDKSLNVIYVSSGYKPERGNEILKILNI